MKTAILAGSTGLIGAQVLQLLLMENSTSADRQVYDRVIALSRTPLALSHNKLTNLIVDFDSLEDYTTQLKGDDVYCCLGTTIKQAGSKAAFLKVDLDYPVSLARITRNQGAHQFLLVTALGANKDSSIFYNRVKGEVQEAIDQVGFESFHIFQPSMLVGPRTRPRRGEIIAQRLMKVVGVLIPRKYKAIESVKVARAMVATAGNSRKGNFVYESTDLQSF